MQMPKSTRREPAGKAVCVEFTRARLGAGGHETSRCRNPGYESGARWGTESAAPRSSGADHMRRMDAFARADCAKVVAVSLETFRSLWQQDYLAQGDQGLARNRYGRYARIAPATQAAGNRVGTSTFTGGSMRKSSTFLSAVTAAALVAGAGIATTPAQAKVTSQVGGSTTITLLPEVYGQLATAGVQFQALDPATSTNPSGTQALHFPVTKPFKSGAVANTGTMAIGAVLNRIDLASPHLEYATRAGATTGRITFQDVYDAVGGDRVTIFGVNNMTVKVTKGRVAKAGAAWKRTDRQVITGDVSIVDDPQLVSALNTYIGTTFFTPGVAFGTLNSKVTTTITCKTRRECA